MGSAQGPGLKPGSGCASSQCWPPERHGQRLKGATRVELLAEFFQGPRLGKGERNLHLNADTGFSPGTEESFPLKC